MSTGTILIIDDEEILRQLLSRLLSLENYEILQAKNGSDGIELLKSQDVHVVITDVRLPDINGIALVSKIKEINPFTEIIVLTAYGTIEDGVKSIKLGAFDYITKGDEDNKIVPVVARAMEKVKLSKRVNHLEQKISNRFSFENIIGNSDKIKDTINLAKKVSASDISILLVGETGTGKEIFAQSIHYQSPRQKFPFVAVNCSAIPHDLLESEMFGYKAGAFTGAVKNKKGLFEEADGGTLFLDEIGEMEIGLQSKLLRVLESNSFIKSGDTKPTNVDVRIIAATNKKLEDEIKTQKFRSDLYYRISAVKIELPPLRERPEDITPLAENFIKLYSNKIKKNITSIDDSFYEALKKYPFPGNTRELKNLIERIVLLTDSECLSIENLPKEIFYENENQPGNLTKLDEVEKEHILKILKQVNQNKTRAAEILGIGITTLYRKLQSYGLE